MAPEDIDSTATEEEVGTSSGLVTLDEDDDLFHFDELMAGSLPTKELDPSIEALLDEEDLGDGSPASEPALAPAAEAEPRSSAAAPPFVSASELQPANMVVGGAPQSGSMFGSPKQAWIFLTLVLSMLLFNVAMVSLSWKSLDTMQTAMTDIGGSVLETAQSMEATTARRAAEVMEWGTISVADQPMGFETIESAIKDLELGDFSGARRRLYALLAVVDQLEEATRPDLEARARLLIAESFRREADLLEEVVQ